VSDGELTITTTVGNLIARNVRSLFESAADNDKMALLRNAAFALLVDQKLQDRLLVEQKLQESTDALHSAELAASNLTSLYDRISAAPKRERSTSATRSDSRPATQQGDDDDAVEQVRARSIAQVDAATVAHTRTVTSNGREFDHFVGRWQLPRSTNVARTNAATAMEASFSSVLSKRINGGETFQTRLESLQTYRDKDASVRSKKKFPREFEVKVTHPFVFAVLKAIKAPLQTLLGNAVLHVYTEKGDIPTVVTYRNADAMFFADSEQNVTYDERARRDSLLAVEAKRSLDNQGKSDALVGGERDFMIVSGEAACEQMRVGTSVFSDGVTWYFARIAWRCVDGLRWEREIKMSPKIDVTRSGGWRNLARWFAFAFDEAVNRPVESTGLRARVAAWLVGATKLQLCDVMSHGLRSVVTRWRSEDDTNSVVIKFMKRADAQRTAKNQRHFEREREMLQMFADDSLFVHVDARLTVSGGFIALEDCGDALASFNIRGAAGKALATIVMRDIWYGALQVLRTKSLCHFDITENNIAIAAGRQSARLIDLESMTEVGFSAAASPTAATVSSRPSNATFQFDEKCVCAILKCLWDDATSSFEKRKTFVDGEFGKKSLRRQLISLIEHSAAT
jgi:hypothetical protein